MRALPVEVVLFMGALLACFLKVLELVRYKFTGTRAPLVEVVPFITALLAYFLEFMELVKHSLYRHARPTFGGCAISGRSSGILS